MDSKAMSVLSMQTLQKVGEGESSKIFFPIEVTKMIEGVSEYMGTAKNIPDREVSDTDSIKNAVGDPDDILGPIPTKEEMSAVTSQAARLKDDIEEDIIPDEKF